MALPLASELGGFGFLFLGQPGIAIDAKPEVNTSGFAYTFLGLPFVGAPAVLGTVYTNDYTEALSLLDVLSTQAAVTNTLSESLVLDQDWSVTLAYDETIALNAAYVPVRIAFAPITYAASLTDAFSAGRNLSASYAESQTFTDAYTNLRRQTVLYSEEQPLTVSYVATGGVTVDIDGDGVARFTVPQQYWEFSVPRPFVRFNVPKGAGELDIPRPGKKFILPE